MADIAALREWVQEHRHPAGFPDYEGGFQSALEQVARLLDLPDPPPEADHAGG